MMISIIIISLPLLCCAPALRRRFFGDSDTMMQRGLYSNAEKEESDNSVKLRRMEQCLHRIEVLQKVKVPILNGSCCGAS